ncbi:MAG TPA: allantoate amidohydrolase [Chloroflexia bacterium]|nr:allantoate amidohydrolase [Chloroflexia bacterium]
MTAEVAAAASIVMQRAEALGQVSEEEGRLTRRFATQAMLRVNAMAAEWMRQAGMSVRRDGIGNLIGRYSTQSAAEGSAPVLVLGSHLDTVRDAGKYDGPLGVLVAIACVSLLQERGTRLPLDIEVVAFADEEGLRYHTAYLGSKAYIGTLDPSCLNLEDADGISLAAALRQAGGDPAAIIAARSAPERILAYCEVHIEQGPVLEREGLPVGVVSAIAGQSRMSLRFEGEAGHAGTVPMEMRRDALAAASEFVLVAEGLARDEPGLVATVGQLEVLQSASNVIPGEVLLSLDVRHQDDATRTEACRILKEEAGRIRHSRGVSVEWQIVQETKSVPCSPGFPELLGRAISAAGYPVRLLPSGAGHDGVIMSQVAPIAMLFVRCKGGISHNPAESVDVGDVAVAIEVMGRFLTAVK